MLTIEEIFTNQNAVLEFLDGTYETIRVTGAITDVEGHPIWIEGHQLNTIGPRPNPKTIWPWAAIKSIRVRD